MPPVRPSVGELERSLSDYRSETDRRFLDADQDRREMRQDMKDQRADLGGLISDIAKAVTEINSRSRNMMLMIILAIMSSLVFPLLVVLVLKAFLK